MELDALQQFNEAAITYGIIPIPTSGGNVSEDVALKEDGELPEGPVLMWGNEEGRYILHNFTHNLLFLPWAQSHSLCWSSVGPNSHYAFYFWYIVL